MIGQRLSIGVRVLVIGLMAGLLLWVVMDHVQTSSISQVMLDDAVGRLDTRANRDRLRLDLRIRSHHGYVTLLAGLAAAQPELLADITGPEDVARLVEGAPRWLPHRALRRLFAQPDVLLVLDATDRVRTQYRLRAGPLPESLAAPDRRLLVQVDAEPVLNFFGDQLFLVAAAPIANGAGRLVGLAQVDSEFLRQAQGAFLDDAGVTALVAGDPQRVLASSDPDRAPPGALLDRLRADYLITGKGFLDYGFSRAQAGFLTLVSRNRVTALTEPVLALERSQRTLLAAAIGGFFFVMLALVVIRLRRLTKRVAAVTKQVFGVAAEQPDSGDEIVALEAQVQLLTSEVLASRAALEAETRERLRLLSEANAQLQREVAARTAELSQALMEAQHANLAKSRFLASASHDLRQPLQAIRLFEAVLRNQLAGSPSELALNRLGESVATAEVLLSALLEMSKIDAGVIVPHPALFTMGALLREIRDEFAPQASERGCELRVLPCSVVVAADALLVGRILRNLVANAIRHAPGSRILVGARRLPAGVRIEVCDRGSGIDPAELTLIFEEFYQLGNPERDRAKGLGLGLSIAKKLADLSQLPLTVRSTVGKGSVFSLVVPCSIGTAGDVRKDAMIA